MKKAFIFTGIALWSILALLILAILVSGLIGFNMHGWFNNLPGYNIKWGGNNSVVVFGSGVELVKQGSPSLEGIDNIIISATYQNINISFNDAGGTMSVHHYDYGEAEGYETVFNGSVLEIRTKTKTVVNILSFDNWPRLDITLPRSYADKISLYSTSGGIKVAGDASWGDTVVKSTSGGIRLEGNFTGGYTQLGTTSGSIRAEASIICGDLSVGSTSGSIHLGRCESSGTVALQSTSGSIGAQSLSGISADIRSSSGSLTLGDVRCQGSVYLKTVSGGKNLGVIKGGGVEIEQTSGGTNADTIEADGMIRIFSVSGSVKAGTVRSPQHIIKTTSGSIKIGTLTGEGDVKSTSGSIKTG